MRKNRIYLFFLAFLFSTLSIMAGEKIHVGDLISLDIKSQLSEEELRDGFKEFYIESLETKDEIYVLKVRPKEPGIIKVKFGNKNIEFEVEALLKDKNNLELEEMTNNANLKLKEKKFPYYIFAFYLILPFFYFWKIKEQKAEKKLLNPQEEFMRDFENLKDEDLVFNLSHIFRRFYDRTEGTRLLHGEFELENQEVEDFIMYLEELKYSKKEYQKEDLLGRSLELYNKVRGEENV